MLPSIFFGAALSLLTAYALGCTLLRRTPAPPEIALALGAVAESALVFFLLLAGAGRWHVFLAMAILSVAAWRMSPRRPLQDPGKRVPRSVRLALTIMLATYGAWYFVNALAPEILADGMTFHLGLPYEYVRRGGFPDRITFYDLVPQGMEMLYTVAFAFGRHSAAKLVEFAFFVASFPLFFRIGRRLGLTGVAALLAAAAFFCAPVAGVTGTSSYNDAAGVFFALGSFYLLLVWRDNSDSRYLLPAGALAGFCYAIKLPGGAVVIAAIVFVLAQRRTRAAAIVALGAALVMAPWLIRNTVLTGNPVAPLADWLFPNPYFHVATEHELAAALRPPASIKPWSMPWQLAFGDGLVGTFGPLLLALPLGLVALRRREGRWCWTAAALLALPWFWNSGARFLMPAVAVAGLTLGMVLPTPLAWAGIALQAVLCWPQVMDLWQTRYTFRLHDFPVAAALRIEPEAAYLSRNADEFKLAQIVEAKTPPDAKILGLLTVGNAYLARDVRVNWQSSEADRMLDSLRLAALNTEPLFAWTANWPAVSLERLRFRLPESRPSECDIDEIRVYSGGEPVYTSPNWTLRAWPNSWEAGVALDGNLATRWRTWEPVRAGMYFEIRFDHPQRITSTVLYSHTPALGVPLEIFGLSTRGQWIPLGSPQAARMPAQDLRLEATRALRRAGYRFVLTPSGGGGTAPLGNALAGQEAEWGMERVAQAGPFYLFHIK